MEMRKAPKSEETIRVCHVYDRRKTVQSDERERKTCLFFFHKGIPGKMNLNIFEMSRLPSMLQ